MAASGSQLMALWKDTGKVMELRNLGEALTFETAKSMISRLRDQKVDPKIIRDELVALGATYNRPEEEATFAGSRQTVQSSKPDFQAIYDEAHAAGTARAKATQPTPMVVQQHVNPLDDNSPVKARWWVDQGACGFAWVQFKGNTAWAKWTKSKGLCGPAHPSGRSIWISDFGQSIELKEAYAYGFAEVLRKHGIDAHAGSRLD